MKNTIIRLCLTLLMSFLLFLALGGALAEEGCLHFDEATETDYMTFTLNDMHAPSMLTQSCSQCGHTSWIALEHQYVMEGSDYTVTVSTGGDPWDGPDAPEAMEVQYYNTVFTPNQVVKPIAKPTAPGTYYASTRFFDWRLFGQLTIVSTDHEHSFSFSASDNVLSAHCQGCGASSTLTLSMSSATAGEAQPASLTQNGAWPNALPEIIYYAADGSPLPALPQEAGNYYAAVIVEGQVAAKAFTLNETVIEPTLLPKERIVSNAPIGMAFAEKNIADGQYQMVIHAKDTDWSAIAAQLFDTQRQMMSWQTPHVKPYPGAGGFKYEIAESAAQIKEKVEKLRSLTPSNNLSGNATLAIRNIGNYTPENGLFVPSSNQDVSTYVLGWYKDGKLIAIELLKSSVTFDDDTPFTITEEKIGAVSLLPAANLNPAIIASMEIAKTDGSVSYRAQSASAVGASVIETGVLLPQEITGKAVTCEIRKDLFSEPATVLVESVSGKPGIRISSAVPTDGSAQGYSYVLTFKDAQGNFLKAYNLTITIRTGEPIPFPLYHSDWEAIPSSRIQLQVSDESGSVPSGLGLSYDDGYGIVNYDIHTRLLPRNRSLDGILGTVHILPPEGAKAYRLYPPYESSLSIRPDMYSMNNDDSLNAEQRIANSPLTRMNSFFGRNVEYPFLQGKEIMLLDGHPYTLYELGLPDMGELGGGFRLIYWYADEEGMELLSKEYLLVTHDPASAPAFTTPVSSESDLDTQSASLPRMIVRRENDDGETVLLYSDIVPQTSDNELHYELRLTDEDGTPVSTETLKRLTPLTIYIPVPDDVDPLNPALSFTVSHLNADSTKVTESFSIADGSLQLIEYGLCFTVDSLSPFVLSWDDSSAPDTSALPKTGDNSPEPFILLTALLTSIAFATLLLLRKRA